MIPSSRHIGFGTPDSPRITEGVDGKKVEHCGRDSYSGRGVDSRIYSRVVVMKNPTNVWSSTSQSGLALQKRFSAMVAVIFVAKTVRPFSDV